MKHAFIVLAALLVLQASLAQNVGINTTTPSEKLDVNGNINVTGTLKANGVDGLANQFLMNNGNGSLMWSSLTNNYSKAVSFYAQGAGQWIVPANVTSIMVQAWGGGGGGSRLCGGGGGGYVEAIFPVTPGTAVSYFVGAGGNGGVNAGFDGQSSNVTLGGLSAYGSGGSRATFGPSNSGIPGNGGSFSGTGVGYVGMPGGTGKAGVTNYIQSTSTVFLETVSNGNGGDGGNAPNTGATGPYRIWNINSSVVQRFIRPSVASSPGGGGSAGYEFFTFTAGTLDGNAGARGFVVIHY